MPTSTEGATLTRDADIFSYTALSIMAGAGGANVQVDADNNGVFEQSAALAEGGTVYVTGVNVGARVQSDRPVQVVLFTGRIGSSYQSRDAYLIPTSGWGTSYYAPVSTTSNYGTVVFLYNPGTSEITVSYAYRSSTSAYTTATISVPAGGNRRVTLTSPRAYRFYTTGAPFYAFCAVDGASSTTTSNQAYDGGFSLLSQSTLSTQVQVSLGIGRDPYSATNPTENGNPVWITTAGNEHTLETVYVDYNGDKAGPLTDPEGNAYDVAYSLRELQQQQIFDPDGDQSGMVVYTLNPAVRIAAVWAQNPANATAGAPGLDVATLLTPLREADAAKRSTVAVDADGDGHPSAGDTLEYDIRVINTSHSEMPGPFTVTDALPANTTYVPGSTKYRYSVNGAWQAWVGVPDDGSGSAFPLDGTGLSLSSTLDYGQQIQVVFRAAVSAYQDLVPAGTSSITNTGTVLTTPFGLTIPVSWTDLLRGSLGDRVWVDENGDGVQDTGETGLNGVVVYADLDNDNVRDADEPAATTAGDGTYLLTGLLAGTYVVRVDPASVAALNPGYGVTYDLDGIATSYVASATLAAGERRTDVDFGFRIDASVGDRVWVDLDADGVQDAGEPGINGVRVFIDADGDGIYDAGERNSITFGDGTYYIGNLPAGGTYEVCVDTTTLPSGLTQTFDLTSPTNDHHATVTFSGAEHRPDLDFGYRGSLSLGDLVWNDVDGDGVQDTGEAGIAGVVVYIDANGNGTRDATEAFATTDSNGAYTIGNLFNGTCTVRVDTTTLPAGMVETYDLTSPTTDHQATVTLSGANRTDVDFGYRDAASLGDRVWNDLDGDGIQDAGEPGIAGVTVYIDASGNNAFDQGVERFAITDLNGIYLIDNLAAGTYSVRVDIGTLPQGSTQTYDLTSPYTDHEASRTLAAGEDAVNVDFGYRSTASVGDFVWLDLDADGVQDAGESGIAGVRVFLDINGNGSFDSASEPSAITSAGGTYSIAGLAPGNYTARVDTATLPSGAVQTYDLAGGLDHAATFILSAGQTRTDLDFGYTQPVTLGDWVWNDANANGLQDTGESGLAGVTVTAYNAANNTIAATTTTASGGAYSFATLLPGSYYVEFGAVTGYDRSPVDQGSDDSKDSDANVTTGRTGTVTLAAGDSNLTLDAGYYQPATLGNLVWIDTDNDGLVDAGEAGVDGVAVELYLSTQTPGVDMPHASTTTAGGGFYQFSGLRPDAYRVHIPAANFGTGMALEHAPLSSAVTSTVDDGIDNDDNGSQPAGGAAVTGPLVTLDAGETDNTLDFGFAPNGSIGNWVFADANNNGVRDSGENGIPGVVVKLFVADGSGNPAGSALQATTTDANGNYRFDDLVAGAYVVVVDAAGSGSALAGYLTSTGHTADLTLAGDLMDHGLDTPLGTGSVLPGGIAAVAVTMVQVAQPLGEILGGEAGAGTHGPNGDATDNLVVDFGFTPAYSIGNRVFRDDDSDGYRDDAEVGIAGVPMYAFAADGNGQPTGDPLASATTDADGCYRLDGLPAGSYVVVMDRANAPAEVSYYTISIAASSDMTLAGDRYNHGWYFPQVNIGTIVNGYASSPVTLGAGLQPTGEVTGGSGQGSNSPYGDDRDNLVLDFGLMRTYCIGNRVFDDLDADGQQDAGEPGIANVALRVFDADENGNPTGNARIIGANGLNVALSSPDGWYRFFRLPAGRYVVVVDVGLSRDLVGYKHVNGSTFIDPTASSQALVDYGTSPGQSTDLTITGDLHDHGQDIPISHAEVAFGVRSVVVEVGPGLQPTDEAVSATDPAGAHGPTGDASDNLVVDFGFTKNHSIGNRIFLDDGTGSGGKKNDGIQNGTEAGIGGVIVELKDSGGAVVASTTTYASGYYRFDDLLAGTYTVFLPGANFSSGALAGMSSSSGVETGDLGDKGIDEADPPANGITTASITLALGSQPTGETDIGSGAGAHGPNGDGYDNLTIDFGFVRGNDTCCIGSLVWHDANNNGACDAGESGIGGVSVEIWSADASGALLALQHTVTTAADGTYYVKNLEPGRYRVRIPAANFGTGQPLVAINTSSTLRDGQDDQVDNDSNGLQASAGQEVLSPVIVLGVGGEPVDGTGVPNEFGPGAMADNSPHDANGDMTVDFGFYSPANDQANLCSLGSVVWNDLDNDGAHDSGEPGIAGVALDLYLNDTTRWATTTTAADGTFFFHDLPPGSWTVRIPAANFTGSGALVATPMTGGTPANSDNQVDGDNNALQPGGMFTAARSPAITLAAGAEPTTAETGAGYGQDDASPYVDANGDMTVDFGFTPTYSLGNRVFRDWDNNGIMDGTDSPVSGARMRLFAADGSGEPTGTALATVDTDENGYYRFDGLVAGTYVVVVDKSASPGMTSGGRSSTGVSSDLGSSGDGTDHGRDTLITLDTVVNGIPSVPVTVGPGLQPTGEATGAGAGGNGPNGDASDTLVVDFGFTPTYSIGNRVFRDRNNDGQLGSDVMDTGGIAGVVMVLFAADESGAPTGTALATTTTDAMGYYRLDGLVAGSYVVVVDVAGSANLAGHVSSTGWRTETGLADDYQDHGLDTPLGTGSVLPGGIAGVAVAVGPGLQPLAEGTGSGQGAHGPCGDANDNLVMDFAFHPLHSLGNRVFADADGDGLMEAGDTGIGGVQVVLFGADPSGNPTGAPVGTTTTDASGYYRFDYLAAGTYVVVVDRPASAALSGYGSSPGASPDYTLAGESHDHGLDLPLGPGSVLPGGIAGTPVGVGTGVLAPQGEGDVSTGAGANGPNGDDADNLVADFGFRQLGAISGSVLADAGSGSHDTPVADVVVTLKDAGGNDIDSDPYTEGVQPTTATTGADGSYAFADLVPGNYQLSQTQPTGYGSVSDKDGGDPDLIGDQALVAVSAGATNSGNDFLEDKYGTISGVVLVDTDLDGTGDTPLPGVPVTLFTDPNNDGSPLDGTAFATVVTDANGAYAFTDVPAGSYVIVESNIDGYANWADGDTTTDRANSPVDAANPSQLDNLLPVNLGVGETDDGNTFVEVQAFTISGQVRNDANSDGMLTDPDFPIAGVTIELFADANHDGVPDGPALRTTVTGGDGSYSFTNVPVGKYLVVETNLPGTTSTGDADGGSADSIAVNLTNADVTGRDFLDHRPCAQSWAEWQYLHPLGGQNGPDDNPEADRNDNLLEYALAGDPESGAGDLFAIQPSATAPGTLEAVFQRPAGAAGDVTYVLEYAAALGGETVWTSIVLTPEMISVSADGCLETVTIPDLETLTGLTAGEGFGRLTVGLDADGDDEVDATSSAEVEGWTETELDLCCHTFNNPYLREAVFTGTVAAVDGQDLSFTGEDLEDLLESGVACYLEVTSGENEGQRFDVVSAAGTTVTLANDSDLDSPAAPFNTLTGAPPASLLGDTVVLRPHWTLGGLFPPEAYAATGSQSTADQVQLHAGGEWVFYWLYDAGDSDPETARWVLAGDNLLTDQGATVLPPGQGMFVLKHPPEVATVSYGEVRANDFVRPLAAGHNLVGGGFPVDQSATGTGSRQMTLAGTGPVAENDFFGSRDFKTADSFFIWRKDAVTGADSYDTCFLLSNSPTNPTVYRWVKVGDATLATQDAAVLFLSDRSVFVRVAAGLPGYRIPCPWQP